MNIEFKKINHVKKYETLKKIILAVGMCENMSEQEIRKNILESTELEKNVNTFVTWKEQFVKLWVLLWMRT